MTANQLGPLALVHLQLALLAIGGVNSVVPELQRQVVDIHHWMSAREFAALFALAQAAPGPNMLVVTLVGWHVAGIPGAAVSTASLLAPAGLLTFFVARAWHRFRSSRWRRVVQAGLTPVTVGLVLAAATLLSASTMRSLGDAAITAVVAIAVLTTRWHPLWLLAAGCALGAAGIV